MDKDSEPTVITDEQAKAVQEVAKLGQSVMEGGGRAGGYIAETFKDVIGHVVGRWSDDAQGKLLQNRIRWVKLLERELEAAGLTGNLERIADRQAFPLLAAIEVEDDDEVQMVWAKYVTNALNPDKPGVSINRRLTDTIRSLEPEDLPILRRIFEIDLSAKTIEATVLPLEAFGVPPEALDFTMTRFVSLGLFTYSVGDYLAVTSGGQEGWPCWVEIRTSLGEYRSAPLLLMLQQAIT